MLNGDLQLKNEATVRTHRLRRPSDDDVDESEAGFHFIAFVPVHGRVWKLDGLERQPQCLGNSATNPSVESALRCAGTFDGEDWVTHAKPVIEARMAEYEEGQIEFGVLSLVKDPLLSLLPALAENVKVSAATSSHLTNLKSDSTGFVFAALHDASSPHEFILTGPDETYGLTADAIEKAVVPAVFQQRLVRAGGADLMTLRHELMSAQARLRASIKEEQQSQCSDDERAASRRHDYGPMVQAWVRLLAQKRMLQPLLEAVQTE